MSTPLSVWSPTQSITTNGEAPNDTPDWEPYYFVLENIGAHGVRLTIRKDPYGTLVDVSQFEVQYDTVEDFANNNAFITLVSNVDFAGGGEAAGVDLQDLIPGTEYFFRARWTPKS